LTALHTARFTLRRICDKPFQALRGVGEVAVFIEMKITGVSES
jgi:hypothetical protein